MAEDTDTEVIKEQLARWVRDDPRMYELWVEGVGEVGAENVLDWLHQQPYYETVFPGNLRDDGSTRLTEDEYFYEIDSYETSLRAVGLSDTAIDMIRPRFAELIEQDVYGREFWQERVEPLYEQITNRGSALIERYAQDWGIEMNAEALFVSLLDPELENKILTRQIAVSELRGELDSAFSQAMTNRYLTLTTDLVEYGVDLGGARRLFQEAANMLPTLSVLAKRHADPDDEFNLDEFVQASIYNDPAENRRMRRLIAQESSLFSGNARAGIARSQAGSVAGLSES